MDILYVGKSYCESPNLINHVLFGSASKRRLTDDYSEAFIAGFLLNVEMRRTGIEPVTLGLKGPCSAD